MSCQYRCQSVVNLVLPRYVVVLFKPDAQVGIVAVAPFFGVGVPRQAASYSVEAAEKVVHNLSCQGRVVFQNEDNVIYVTYQLSAFSILQLRFPFVAVVFRQFHVGEVIGYRLLAFAGHEQLHVAV